MLKINVTLPKPTTTTDKGREHDSRQKATRRHQDGQRETSYHTALGGCRPFR